MMTQQDILECLYSSVVDYRDLQFKKILMDIKLDDLSKHIKTLNNNLTDKEKRKFLKENLFINIEDYIP